MERKSNVALKLPKKIFYTLNDLKTCWQVGQSDLQQWLTRGNLSACAWFPVMSVFTESKDRSEGQPPLLLRHWEGYIPVSRHHCCRLFRQGFVRLREFTDMDHREKFILPDTADDVSIALDDLVVLDEERMRFECDHGIQKPSVTPTAVNDSDTPLGVVFDPTFQQVRFNGQQHYFGTVQADVLRILYEAARDGEPWLNGKRLLQEAGSQSYKLSNVFKRKPIRQKLIVSSGRGSYRLDDDFLASLEIDKKRE